MEEDIKRIREMAQKFREMADVYDELALISEERPDDEKAISEVVGKLVLLQVRLQQLSN